jgi:3-oxoacyl-[acyl-carrier protein] reductase
MALAVVTGAARGIGRSVARSLSAQDWSVVAIDRDGRALSGLTDVHKREQVDVAIADDCARLAEIVGSLGSPLRGLVNCAGIYPPTRLQDFTVELYERIFSINVLGTLLMTQALMPHLVAGAPAAVVNLASDNAFEAATDQLLYGAAKAAVVSITRSIGVQYAARQVRVNAVAPGWVDTDGTRASGRIQAAAHEVPMGRAATGDEIAEIIAWLLDPNASGFVTGETVLATGGQVTR